MDKIRRIFPLLILFTLLSCADTIETRIPYRIVSLELDLAYQDKALNAIQAYKIYTQANIDQDREQTGFGGVLVYHGLSSNGTGAFFAFDAACPHEASANVIVDVDESAVYAICPKCGSKFELLNGEEREQEMPLLRSVLLSAAVGFGTGMYDGFFGPGAGTFMTLLLNSVLGLGIIRACGTTKVVNLASNVAALITYGMSGNVLVDVGIKCTIFSVLGNWVGSGLALKKGAKVVRPIMIVAMLLLLGKIASNMFLA